MSFEARADASAARLVAHFGEGLSVTVRSVGGTLGADRSVAPSLQSMTVPCTKPAPYAQRLIDGTRIQAGDVRVSIQAGHPARTFAPAPDMLADLAGVTYRIESVVPEAGGFELQLRGAA